MTAPTEIELDGQYRALREAAGVVERERRTLLLSGPDAVDYLEGQITNEIGSLAEGEGRYAALLDRKGRMQGDLRVLARPEGMRLDFEPVAAAAIVRHLAMYRVASDLEIADESDERALLSVIGPAASEIALGGPAGVEHASREAHLGGAAALAIATDLGVDLLLLRADVERTRDALEVAGAEPVSEAAAEIVRVESGRPRFGHEMTATTIPQEAGINERAVNFTKGCYIGQETVARLHYKGKPNRHLRGLALSEPARAGDPIRLGERELGAIGTAVLSPTRGPIALAIVRREARPGDEVTVGVGAAATLVELPF